MFELFKRSIKPVTKTLFTLAKVTLTLNSAAYLFNSTNEKLSKGNTLGAFADFTAGVSFITTSYISINNFIKTYLIKNIAKNYNNPIEKAKHFLRRKTSAVLLSCGIWFGFVQPTYDLLSGSEGDDKTNAQKLVYITSFLYAAGLSTVNFFKILSRLEDAPTVKEYNELVNKERANPEKGFFEVRQEFLNERNLRHRADALESNNRQFREL